MRLASPALKTVFRHAQLSIALAISIGCCLAITGCTGPGFKKNPPEKVESDPISLREGDVIRITFPGAPNLNTTAAIRRDGKITLELVGEVTAAGLTPKDLQKELVRLYSDQLIDKEVYVTIESSSFPVFVTGAILHPGKILSNRPISALEAIMEAGGFDYTRANLKSVQVIREVDGQMHHYTINLKQVLAGEETKPFHLKPSDIIYVPERFTWF